MLSTTALVRTHNSDCVKGLSRSITSLLNQTRQPERVFILEDGGVSGALAKTARSLEGDNDAVHVERFDTSVTRGEALKRGVLAAETPLVAILDCGDVSVSKRIELQEDVLEQHSGIDVVGGYVQEFVSTPEDANRVRTVPTDPEDVRSFAKSRSPVNQPTVCFRRNSILEVGNYGSRQRLEDYELWVRILKEGRQIVNLDRVLTKVKVDNSFYARRGGLKYLHEESELHREFYNMGFITAAQLVRNLATRVPIRLLPACCRVAIYNYILRE